MKRIVLDRSWERLQNHATVLKTWFYTLFFSAVLLLWFWYERSDWDLFMFNLDCKFVAAFEHCTYFCIIYNILAMSYAYEYLLCYLNFLTFRFQNVWDGDKQTLIVAVEE